MDGEIHVKSPYVAPTIRKVDGQIVNLTATDFHPTSDLGTVDDDNELYVLGRVGDQIKKGGEFLSLIEIENVVLSLPAVKDCLSIPCLSEYWGQDFVLLVVAPQATNRESESLEQQILRAISGALGPRALPSRIDIVELIARTDSGKALRRVYLFENLDNESGHEER
jgi:fatty-acyl-CoA synthase